MVKRWIIYLAALLGCFIFYVAHRQLIAWLILVMMLSVPLFSLGFLLIHSLTLHAQLLFPGEMAQGQPQRLQMTFSKQPLLSWNYQTAVRNTLTGEVYLIHPGELVPAAHCGQLLCSSMGLYILDPLGLFRIRLLPHRQWTILVRPTSVPMVMATEDSRKLSQSWKPKPGGGYSEQHDLRQYRPGDSLNQIHWKLTAKTGKFIIREAMIPNHGRILLTLYLRGTPQQLDEKLGNLLWMGNHLLDGGIPFEVQAVTSLGTGHWTINTQESLDNLMVDLLRSEPAPDNALIQSLDASWHCHIGGDGNEE